MPEPEKTPTQKTARLPHRRHLSAPSTAPSTRPQPRPQTRPQTGVQMGSSGPPMAMQIGPSIGPQAVSSMGPQAVSSMGPQMGQSMPPQMVPQIAPWMVPQIAPQMTLSTAELTASMSQSAPPRSQPMVSSRVQPLGPSRSQPTAPPITAQMDMFMASGVPSTPNSSMSVVSRPVRPDCSSSVDSAIESAGHYSPHSRNGRVPKLWNCHGQCHSAPIHRDGSWVPRPRPFVLPTPSPISSGPLGKF
jgi:hypothetical protein